MRAHGLAPHIAQHGVVLVKAINAGGAKRTRTRRIPSIGNQGDNRLADGLVAALTETAPIGGALRVVALGQLTTEVGEPLAECRWSDLPTLGEVGDRTDAPIAQQRGKSASDHCPTEWIVAPTGRRRTVEVETRPRPSRQARGGPSAAGDRPIRGECDLDRIGPQAHAHREERAQAQRALIPTRGLESGAIQPQVFGERIEAAPGTLYPSRLHERRKADGTRTLRGFPLMCEHLMDGEGGPPIPSRLDARIHTTGGFAARPLRARKICPAALAVSNGNGLGNCALGASANEATLCEKHFVRRTPANRRHSPQQGLPELDPQFAPMGETARTPTLARTQDGSGTSRREQKAPRQEGMKRKVRLVRQLLEGRDEVLRARPETVEINAVGREVQGKARPRQQETIRYEGADKTVEYVGDADAARNAQPRDVAAETLDKSRPERSRITAVERSPREHRSGHAVALGLGDANAPARASLGLHRRRG